MYFNRVNMKIALFCSFLLLHGMISAQCVDFPATIAEPTCGTGTPLANNQNINAGQTSTFCGTNSSPVNFSSINLNGGSITVCGNANLSGNWNSGTIVIACGATVGFPSGLLLNNNVKVVNYGRVNITGTLEFQNSNNCFYNESSTALLYVSGNIRFPQNNGQNAYLKNNGYISVGGTFEALDGGFTCFGANSSMETVNLTYGQNCGAPNNRFIYGSASGTAVLRYTGSATLRATFTSAGNYRINRGGSATQSLPCGASSWGSATTATNTPAIVVPTQGTCATANCFTVLPVELAYFSASAEENGVALEWQTVSEKNNAFFRPERSADNQTWEPIGELPGAGNSESTLDYSFFDRHPPMGNSYYRIAQVDTDGTTDYSEVRAITYFPGTSMQLFPNPAENTLNILTAKEFNPIMVRLINNWGNTVLQQTLGGHQIELIELENISSGQYILEVVNLKGELIRQALTKL